MARAAAVNVDARTPATGLPLHRWIIFVSSHLQEHLFGRMPPLLVCGSCTCVVLYFFQTDPVFSCETHGVFCVSLPTEL